MPFSSAWAEALDPVPAATDVLPSWVTSSPSFPGREVYLRCLHLVDLMRVCRYAEDCLVASKCVR